MVARCALVAVVVMASCSRPADVTFDAAPDAPCASTPTFVPVAANGAMIDRVRYRDGELHVSAVGHKLTL